VEYVWHRTSEMTILWIVETKYHFSLKMEHWVNKVHITVVDTVKSCIQYAIRLSYNMQNYINYQWMIKLQVRVIIHVAAWQVLSNVNKMQCMLFMHGRSRRQRSRRQLKAESVFKLVLQFLRCVITSISYCNDFKELLAAWSIQQWLLLLPVYMYIFAAGELKVEKHLALNKIGHGK